MNRRELLLLAAAFALSCGVPTVALPPRQFLGAAREVGRLWLATTGRGEKLRSLAGHLFDGVADLDAAGVSAHLLDLHRADLAASRTTTVQGWVLSLTEARLYGYLALS